jgi:DNA polymerase-3 subunit alpha
MSFVHLHFHTSYSFLDGYNPIKKAVNRIVELGMDACAITDHNHLGGCIEFQAECKARGIKPLLGMEGYYTEKMNELAKPIDERKKDALELAIADGAIDAGDAAKMKASALKEIIAPYMYDTHAYHILFIAKNLTGWHNLVKLQSEAARLCTFNGRYHCDKDLLSKYHEGIICTTACIGSFPSKMIQKGEYDRALSYILDMKDIFGDDFYLEIQPLNIEEQRITNLTYLDLAEEYDINTVATNDVHWTYKEDYDDHDTLLCIGTGRRKHDLDRMKYSDDFWIKSSEEMIQSFEEQSSYIVDTDQEKYAEFYAEAVERTHEIADKVDENIPLGSPKPLFSNVKVPHGFNPTQYLSLLAWKGLYSYLAQHPECDKAMYEARLNEELNIICPKGFAPYMLAVREYVTWANENNCPTGPGRGSAAGSLVLFSIGVTKIIDPIKYGLWFSRFLTKDRMAPPDIDIDFEYTHRDDVVHHLEDYYGKEYVAHIGTYTQEGVKSGITDIGRVLDIPLPEVKSITKKISEIVGGDAVPVKFKDLDKMKEGDENERKNWEAFNELEEDHEELFRLARAFEGTPRNTGVHASGILVTPVPVSDIAPVIYSKDGTAITLYTGPQLEEANFIKSIY